MDSRTRIPRVNKGFSSNFSEDYPFRQIANIIFKTAPLGNLTNLIVSRNKGFKS